MKKLETTQQYQDTIERTKGVKAVLFTQFFEKCDRCEKAKKAVNSLDINTEVFEFSAPKDSYPLPSLKIDTVPTLVLFNDGKEVKRVQGITDYVNSYKSLLK